MVFDPDGRFLDTIVDIGFIAYDLYDIGSSIASGEGVSGTQVAALGADIAGALVPFATGGAAVRAGVKGAGKVAEVAKGVDKATDTGKAGNAAKKSGRAKNKLKPDPTAQSDHTVFKADKKGNITNHATFEANPNNPSGFQEVQRTDIVGNAYFNKKTSKEVPTPHTHDKKTQGGVRQAKPNEIPKTRKEDKK